MTKVKNRYQISFLVVLISVVLAFCVFIGTITAWLMVDYEEHSEGLELGTVKVELYNGATQVQGTRVDGDGNVISTHATISIPSNNSTLRTLTITLRNTGTINCLVRVQFNIYYLENDGNKRTVHMSSTSGNPYISSMTTTNWVRDLLPEVAVGEMFYNSQVSPYNNVTIDGSGNITTSPQSSNAVAIFEDITTNDALKYQDLYIDVTVDAIAYSGNIYKKADAGESVPVEAYPFGTLDTLPSDWTAWQ